MATAVLQTAEEQITCTICFEVFEEPKALPCLHTFCKGCIAKYIMEMGSHHGDRKGYMCPVCRRFVTAPAHIKRNPELWVNQLENNHVIATMIDAHKAPRRPTTETCSEHPEKELEFFCVDHTEFICSLCSLKHRRCTDVITRSEARDNIKRSAKSNSSKAPTQTGADQYVELFMQQCNTIERLIDQRSNGMECLDKSENNIRDGVIRMRKRINELLNKHEEKVLTRLAKIKTRNIAKLEKDKQKLESYGGRSRQKLELVQKLVDKRNVDDKTMEAIKSEYKDLQLKIVEAGEKVTDERIAFTMSPAIENFIVQFDNFGKLEITSSGTGRNDALVDRSKEAPNGGHSGDGNDALNQVRRSGDILIPPQPKSSWITGIAVLPSGRLLLVDHTNETILIFNSTFQFICKTSIQPSPYDLAVISSVEDLVMVSCPDSREVRRCDVLPDGHVNVGPTLKTQVACRSVSSDGTHLAVCSNTAVQVYEGQDDVWMKVLDESFARTKFTYVTMSSSERKVFLTDQSYPDPHVRCLSFAGSTLWQVTDDRISFSTGIAVMGTQLLVTSWDSGKILTLSHNGADLKDYGGCAVTFPWKLYISPDQKSLFVSQHKNTLSDEERRTIKVFTIK